MVNFPKTKTRFRSRHEIDNSFSIHACKLYNIRQKNSLLNRVISLGNQPLNTVVSVSVNRAPVSEILSFAHMTKAYQSDYSVSCSFWA